MLLEVVCTDQESDSQSSFPYKSTQTFSLFGSVRFALSHYLSVTKANKTPNARTCSIFQ